MTPTSCTIGPIAPGATDTSCEFTYTVTQDDMDAFFSSGGDEFGGFTNTASVTATPANTDLNPITEEDDVFARGPPREPRINLVKESTTTEITTYNQRVVYTYTIANTGNITLFEAPEITDDKIGIFTCSGMPASGIAPSEFYQCTAEYFVTEADLDAGFVTNIATASSSEVPDDATASLTIDAVRTPSVSVTKTASPTAGVGVGDTVTYAYEVTNTGNVTLTDVTLDDQHTSAAGTASLPIQSDALTGDVNETGTSTDIAGPGIWSVLRAGDTVTFSAQYTLTQDDIDAEGNITNTATITATPPVGAAVSAQDTVSVAPEAAAPELTALKTVGTSTLSDPPVAGETVNFDISIENTGNQTLSTISLVEDLRRADGTALTIATPSFTGGDTGNDDEMAPGEIWTYTVSHELTQADVDAGGITNSVQARALDPDGALVTDTSDDDDLSNGSTTPARVLIPSEPGIEGQKTITTAATEVGQTIAFEIAVTNTGNVTLDSVAVASDTLTRLDGTPLDLASGPTFTGASDGSSSGTLIPGETALYRVTYVLVQADIDAGGIENTATVTGTPPVGSPLTDVTDDGDDTDGNTDNDKTQQLIEADPSISLTKALAEGSDPTYSAVGTVLNYVFTVTNTGNVTLFDAIAITDPLITDAGGAITCDDITVDGLAPGEAAECTGSYAVTQSDIDDGAVDNTATADVGAVPSDPATETVPALELPELTLVKTGEEIASEDFITGAEVTYTFTTTNTGNTTIFDPVTVVDTLIPAEDITCPAFPAAGLAPAEEYVCTGVYTVTATDVDLGSVTNIASATDGETTSLLDSATVPNEGVPSLSITKTAEVTSFATVGDEIPYTFVVTNSGTRAFASDVIVTDTLFGDVTCFTPSAGDPDLIAGESVTCSGTYTVTQEDLDTGTVVNEAYAATEFGSDDTTVLSEPVVETVDGDLQPELTVAKSAATLPVTGVDQLLTYTVTVTNSGNQTLTNVEASDPMLTGFTCPAQDLAPDETFSCSGTYTVTQADVDVGSLSNTADAAGVSPQGAAIEGADTLVVAMPAPEPSVALTKTATPSPFGPVGSTLTYLFAVENTGNVTLSDLTVTDSMDVNYACVIATLAPGETNSSCSFEVTVTQDMVDDGFVDNTASVTGSDPNGTRVAGEDEISTDGPEQLPSLEATKIVLPSAAVVGAPVTFQLRVENTGNVTLSDVSFVDTMETLDGVSVTLDAPFALVSGTDDGADTLLSVGEVWFLTAQITLTQDIIDDGGLSNQVTVSATDPGDAPVSDLSDNGNDADGDTTGDPTIFVVPSEPQLTTVKSVTTAATAVGEEVVFQISATNSGNVTLTAPTLISDAFSRLDGTPIAATPTPVSVPDPLAVGETAVWELRHVLTQDDLDAGGLSNTALVGATAPDDVAVSDLSADDDPFDGNLDDDPTRFEIAPMPAMEVLKVATSVGTSAGAPVEFEISVTNTGTVTLSNLTMSDTVTDQDGLNPRDVALSFVSSDGDPASAEGTLKPGETATYVGTVTLLQSDIQSGGLINQASAAAQTPQGGSFSEASDAEGDGGNDPTIVNVTPEPSLEVVKSELDRRILFPTVEELTFRIEVTNTGNVIQTGINVVDDLAAFVAPAVLLTDTYPIEISHSGFADAEANPSYDGVSDIALLSGNPTLAPGETGLVDVTFVYIAATGGPAQDNIAAANSDQLSAFAEGSVGIDTTDADGDGIPDVLETGDRDGDGVPDDEDYDPTGYFYCEDNGQILSGGQITVTGNGFSQSGVGTSGSIVVVQDGSLGSFQFYVTAPGTYTLELSYPTVGAPSTARTSAGTLDATSLLPNNPGVLGSGEDGSSGYLVDASAGANAFYTTFVFEAGDPFVINNNIPVTACQEATPVLATKTADRSSAVVGETVNYTLSFRNDSSVTYTDARIFDRLPEDIVYTPGSARVDGVAQEPDQIGNLLAWDVDLAPTQEITVTFAARVTSAAEFGTRTNRTWLEDSNGNQVSNTAEADVRIEPEHVFDCSDVIGKVFDDRNGNGYQDGPRDTSGDITDQDVFRDGKLGKLTLPPEARVEEPGLPNVRLVSPDGTVVTTDAFGRFSVPCAALPRDIGSNFQLKLDTRSLPSGYRVTTENPRNIRVTAGRVSKMNFGAMASQLVNVTLSNSAFLPGAVAATPALDAGLDTLVRQIATTPSVLHLTYQLQAGEALPLARARLSALEKTLRQKWRGTGRYKLLIERMITKGAQ